MHRGRGHHAGPPGHVLFVQPGAGCVAARGGRDRVMSADVSVDEYASALASGIEAALPGWVSACVAQVFVAATGAPPPADVVAAATAAGVLAGEEVGPVVRTLL